MSSAVSWENKLVILFLTSVNFQIDTGFMFAQLL